MLEFKIRINVQMKTRETFLNQTNSNDASKIKNISSILSNSILARQEQGNYSLSHLKFCKYIITQ